DPTYQGPRMNRKTQLVSMAVAAALAGSLTGVARADQPAAVAAVSPEQLQTVVVTATKRQTLAQNTPISMTVLTSADIANRGLTDFNTLTQGFRVPACALAVRAWPDYGCRGLNSAAATPRWSGCIWMR